MARVFLDDGIQSIVQRSFRSQKNGAKKNTARFAVPGRDISGIGSEVGPRTKKLPVSHTKQKKLLKHHFFFVCKGNSIGSTRTFVSLELGVMEVILPSRDTHCDSPIPSPTYPWNVSHPFWAGSLLSNGDCVRIPPFLGPFEGGLYARGSLSTA